MRRLAAVIGSPVAHSLSPVIHQAAFDAAGVDWSYVPFEVAPGSGAAAVEAMRTLGIAGLSVTMPHKADVFAAVDRVDVAARALRSVNTVAWEGSGLVGSSTDGAGFVASLAEHGVDVADATVAVLGAGGAARSLVDALDRARVAEILVVNRSADRAGEAAALSGRARVAAVDDVTIADIVVNATSVGMGVPAGPVDDPDGDDVSDMPSDPRLLQPGQIAVDLVYHPLQTRWLAAAAARGVRTIDGLGMLVHQAALQQLAWLGTLPDVAVMRAAAETALAARAVG